MACLKTIVPNPRLNDQRPNAMGNNNHVRVLCCDTQHEAISFMPRRQIFTSKTQEKFHQNNARSKQKASSPITLISINSDITLS
jgi:hypothetical protein